MLQNGLLNNCICLGNNLIEFILIYKLTILIRPLLPFTIEICSSSSIWKDLRLLPTFIYIGLFHFLQILDIVPKIMLQILMMPWHRMWDAIFWNWILVSRHLIIVLRVENKNRDRPGLTSSTN
jgi:hypothetical protein